MDSPGVTEQRLEASLALDRLSVGEILALMNRQDETVPAVVAGALPAIGQAIDRIVGCFARGGRLIYVGAGTSGRLGVLDATECPPTFGTPPDMVQAIIAGGMEACWRAIEGAEDDPADGARQVADRNVGPNDCVCGIAASGRTPYVLGAVQEARRRGAATVTVVCNPDTPLTRDVDVPIVVQVGPEVLTGSTRLKAGTAQKMVLNMLSTVSLVKSGRVVGNLMFGMMLTSQKLRRRATRMLQQELGVDEARAQALIEASGGRVPVAYLMGASGRGADEVATVLDSVRYNMAEALRRLKA